MHLFHQTVTISNFLIALALDVHSNIELALSTLKYHTLTGILLNFVVSQFSFHYLLYLFYLIIHHVGTTSEPNPNRKINSY